MLIINVDDDSHEYLSQTLIKVQAIWPIEYFELRRVHIQVDCG